MTLFMQTKLMTAFPRSNCGLWLAVGLALSMTHCSGSGCPEGKVKRGSRCEEVPVDAAGADSAGDASGGAAGAEGDRADASLPDAATEPGTDHDADQPDAAVEAGDAGEPSPCLFAECHPRATCNPSTGEAVCECNEGYRGDGVDVCERDECVPLGEDPAPCGVNASCEDPSSASGDFECTCEPGYVHCEAEGDSQADGGGEPVTGCETHLESDRENCGECGFVCAGSLSCNEGACEQIAGELIVSGHNACVLLEPATADGARSVRCWGSNMSNVLRDPEQGTDPASYRATAAEVAGIDAVRDIAIGGRTQLELGHACALDGASDIVRCWGDNGFYQLGSPSTDVSLTEIVELRLPGVRAIETGLAHTCALMRAGTVQCWGQASTLGGGEGASTARPQTVPGLDNVVELVARGLVTCARTEEGRVACWGHVSYGTDFRPTFLSLPNAPLSDAVQMSIGGLSLFEPFGCVVRQTGTVACWGSNRNGELGNPSVDEEGVALPRYVEVPGLSDIVDVTAGQSHACALQASGQVYCWGLDVGGQLGVNPGATEDSIVDSPAPVVGLDDAIDIAGGAEHTCARRRSGQVVCWGANTLGQLGDGSGIERAGIVNVHGLP